ncbi:LamB/YcsF family protein [Salisediminibacterium beveridgei]|uniref:5-oxoprolinase subunit A n=1 Tax=Salisediminibacterium beveridgei TaxID=632773 RepID=A0A1D7QS96_9BACI|nr:5-oxoprolinase subunit PxpA [Salisediminibacterium beveridgei]AOM81869.1 Lactam utilization protein LamB [Salisediminibacterium beveridgei]
MLTIDLNADIGESFGVYRLGDDEALLDVVTSANIACGFHAGDYRTMNKAVKSAVMKGVAIGAHPGYPDLFGFGRRPMAMPAEEIHELLVYQIGAMQGYCRANGTLLHHVKPHGALYNTAAADPLVAQAVAKAVKDVCPEARLMGLAGSELVKAGHEAGLQVMAEAFADRQYTAEGRLVSRGSPGAVLEAEDDVVTQVTGIVFRQQVEAIDGRAVPIQADTLCFHGDGKEAAVLAKVVRTKLEQAGVRCQSPASAGDE